MEILKNNQFMRLWGNQILLQVAFNMSNFTALLILADRTHSPFVQALFYTALTVPAIIFGLIAGPVVDMTDRKKLMLITDGLLAILFLLYIFAANDVALILLIAFLTSSVARFFIPAEAASIPLVVDKNTLNHANSFFLFTLMGSVILGYAMAGPIIQAFGGLNTFGEKVPFIVSSIFLIIGFILRLSLKKIEFERPSVWGDSLVGKTFILFAQTVKEVKTNVKISLPLGLLVFVELMIGLLSVLLLEYVHRYLNLPLTSISYVLMVPLVLGLIVGVGVLGRIEKVYKKRMSIFLSLITSGIILIAIGLAPALLNGSPIGILIERWIAVSASFFLGIAVVFIAVQARTILQTNSHETMHGRIFSFLDVMIAFVTPIPVLITGLLADKISLLGSLIFIGGTIIVLTYLAHNFILRK